MKKTITKKAAAKPALVPKLRFPEFRGKEGWKSIPLNRLATRAKQKNRDEKIDRVLTNSAEFGVVDQREFFDKDIATQGKLEGYFVVELGSYVYNPRISSTAPVGPISKNKIGTGVMSPLYTVFKFKDDRNDFYEYFFKTTGWHTYMRQASSTGARHDRMAISSDDFMAMPLPVSSPDEQQKIAECLSSVDELIGAESRKLDALKGHKKGLMQELFPRDGETQPRRRFPEFQNAGEWVEEKLDDLIHLQDGFAFKSTDFVKSKGDATQVIRITDINNKNTNEDKVFISNLFLESNNLTKYSVEDGDLLLSLTGAAGFNFFFWDGGRAVINQRTAKVTPKKKSSRALLQLLEPLIYEKINERGEGQNNNLSKEFLSTIVLLVPEPAEQQRIADCLTTLDDLIAAQTQKLDVLKIHKKGLMQQLFPSSEATQGTKDVSSVQEEGS